MAQGFTSPKDGCQCVHEFHVVPIVGGRGIPFLWLNRLFRSLVEIVTYWDDHLSKALWIHCAIVK